MFVPGSRAQFARKRGRGSGCKFVSPLDGLHHRVCCALSAVAAAAGPCWVSAGNSPSDVAILSDHRWRCIPPTPRSPN